ncbi:hypothetical protein PGTUg99_000601 [Puccinia graminis f. sp. tritici]|uniref:Uncharacterized protein n=1 Tax=Puccinia graminis f. sp. tritici TaxID=56615 RepID=A0A5B0SIW4_PUCGR|nr:hypothetical protein PGTUg99_000601 [Puccinia graminis f. sp. tritici]
MASAQRLSLAPVTLWAVGAPCGTLGLTPFPGYTALQIIRALHALRFLPAPFSLGFFRFIRLLSSLLQPNPTVQLTPTLHLSPTNQPTTTLHSSPTLLPHPSTVTHL